MENKRLGKNSNLHSSEALFQCAAVVLPYLDAVELASISSTCKTLFNISKSITSIRISDASRGFEPAPIPFLNPISSDPHPYTYFFYSPTHLLQLSPDFRQPWGSVLDAHSRPDPFLFRVEDATGCECASCTEDSCPCLECGPSCNCESSCGNRATQSGVTVRLKIIKDARKGWSLHAAGIIVSGEFICEYAGELLSTKEAGERHRRYDEHDRVTPALLVVKEHFPSGNTFIRINIDATRIGNVARFINHSCDGGNLDTVIIRSSGALFPRVCFFAAKDIQEDEELTFCYGDVRLNPNGLPCFCGTSSCSGTLPNELT